MTAKSNLKEGFHIDLKQVIKEDGISSPTQCNSFRRYIPPWVISVGGMLLITTNRVVDTVNTILHSNGMLVYRRQSSTMFVPKRFPVEWQHDS